MSVRHLECLLAPRSVVVVGASNRPGSAGTTAWNNLRAGNFQGAIRPLNPAHRLLDGEHVYSRCADLPAVPDLAVVCVPPEHVVGAVADLARCGTPAAIVMTAGLDAATKMALRQVARPTLMRLLGPGSLGLLAPRLGLNASLAPVDALPGELAFVSQSGALLTAVAEWGRARRVGFSNLVALGEHLDVDVADLLDYLASDAGTRAILLYVESIESPRKFMSAARAAARNKPVIIVKAGRTASGAAAVGRHAGGRKDGAVGDDAVVDAALRRAGALRVDTLEDLFLAAETLTRFRADTERGLTIVTNGAGAGVIAADACARAGVPLPAPGRDLSATLGADLPPGWSHGNPVTVGPDAPVARFTEALHAVLQDSERGAVLMVHAPTAFARCDELAQACLPMLREARERALVCWLGHVTSAEARRLLEDAGIACYATPEEAVRAFDMLATYRRNQALLTQAPEAVPAAASDPARARALVAAAVAAGHDELDAAQSLELLAAYGVPTARDSHGDAVADAGIGTGDAAPARMQLTIEAYPDPVFGAVLSVAARRSDAPAADRAIGLPPLDRVLAREQLARSAFAHGLEAMPGALEAVCDVLVAVSHLQSDLPELQSLTIEPLAVDGGRVVARAARVRLAPALGAATDHFAILPYPTDLVHDVPWQGHVLQVRPIRPEDEPLHAAFLMQIDPEDIRMRIFSARRDLPRSELARLVQIDYAREMAFVAVQTDAEGRPAILGVSRAICDPDNADAEFGVLVRSDLKGKGLGGLLLRTLIEYLRGHGTQRLVGLVLSENSSMRGLAQHCGLDCQPCPSEPDVVQCTLKLQVAQA